MINTLIVGLGNIGFKFDRKSPKKQITHASAIHFHKKFKLVGGVDKKKKILKEFSNIYNVPVFTNLKKSLSKTNAQLIIFAYQPSLNDIVLAYSNKNIQFILIEKPFLKNALYTRSLLNKLKKKNIGITINFQRNFSPKYLKLINQIKKGIIGNKFKIYCYYSNNFFNNGVHFLNLITLFLKNIKTINTINNKNENLHINSNNGDVYFFKVGDNKYNNNSISIFGDKGKIEITSRPEKCEIHKVVKDSKYKNYFILKKIKSFSLESKFVQESVLDNIYDVIKNNKKLIFDDKKIYNYINTINKIKSL